jgi:hypothetical protein
MRDLNTMDTLKVATIIGKMGMSAGELLKENMNDQQIGLIFFTSALQYAEKDIRDLLASISEMTPDEFDKQPFDYPLDLIEQLSEKEDIQLFFEKAQKLAQKMFAKQ